MEPKEIRWEENFDERQIKEINFSLFYAHQFNHGTDGHNSKLIVARFAGMMSRVEQLLEEADPEKNPAVERILHAFRTLAS